MSIQLPTSGAAAVSTNRCRGAPTSLHYPPIRHVPQGRSMEVFGGKEGERLIRVVDAYDAISEFVKLNYGPMLETSEGLVMIYADTFRGTHPTGFPSDVSTWDVWLEACNRVEQKLT